MLHHGSNRGGIGMKNLRWKSSDVASRLSPKIEIALAQCRNFEMALFFAWNTAQVKLATHASPERRLIRIGARISYGNGCVNRPAPAGVRCHPLLSGFE